MEHAQHILLWAENDAASYKRLLKLATQGNYITMKGRYFDASNLVIAVYEKMRKANDIASTVQETDLAKAVVLFLDWRHVA